MKIFYWAAAFLLVGGSLRAGEAYDYADRFGQIYATSERHNDMFAASLFQAMTDHHITANLVTMK